MKKYILIVLFVSTVSGFAQSGWVWQNPMPQGNTINQIAIKNLTNEYAVTSGGDLLLSTNSGLNWILYKHISTQSLNSIFFVNENTAFICGNSGEFLVSTNGGIDWINRNAPPAYNLMKMFFVNSSTGLVTSQSYIFKTTNSGINWTQNLGYPVRTINFPSINAGYMSNGSSLLKTTNVGATWQQLGGGFTYTVESLYFVDDNTGFISGGYSFFRKTTNGGLNWSSQTLGYDNSFLDIKFYDINTGVAVGWGGMIVVTTNSGANWYLGIFAPWNTGADLKTVCYASSTLWCAAGEKGLIKRTDNAFTWNEMTQGTRANFRSAAFVDLNNGFVIGDSGIVEKTSDAGANWVKTYIPYTGLLSSIAFPDMNTGFVTGVVNNYSSVIFRTTNSDQDWTQQTIPCAAQSLHFINALTGFAAGYYQSYPVYAGVILKTTNSGITWYNVSPNNSRQIDDVCFPDGQTGYACGANGYVYKSTNAGENWFEIQNGLTSSLYTISFINSLTGFTGGTSSVLKTSNGGLNWFYIFNGVADIQDLVFFSTNTGYLIGGYRGTVYKTTNSGLNWSSQITLDAGLNGIFFFNTNTGFIVGDNGTILKTTTGGEPIGVQQISTEVPQSFVLHQNYPNPFNPTTKIRFSLPNPSEGVAMYRSVTLIIYDILGKVVAELLPPLRGGQEGLAPGVYEAVWDASNFASGVYFYQLVVNTPRPDKSGHPSQEGTIIQTKKMVLLK